MAKGDQPGKEENGTRYFFGNRAEDRFLRRAGYDLFKYAGLVALLAAFYFWLGDTKWMDKEEARFELKRIDKEITEKTTDYKMLTKDINYIKRDLQEIKDALKNGHH